MSELPGLRETEERVREALCDEVAEGIDLDEVARAIASVVTTGRRKAARLGAGGVHGTRAESATAQPPSIEDEGMDRVRDTMAQAREERARARR